jgi:hypothetical protein
MTTETSILTLIPQLDAPNLVILLRTCSIYALEYQNMSQEKKDGQKFGLNVLQCKNEAIDYEFKRIIQKYEKVSQEVLEVEASRDNQKIKIFMQNLHSDLSSFLVRSDYAQCILNYIADIGALPDSI